MALCCRKAQNPGGSAISTVMLRHNIDPCIVVIEVYISFHKLIINVISILAEKYLAVIVQLYLLPSLTLQCWELNTRRHYTASKLPKIWNLASVFSPFFKKNNTWAWFLWTIVMACTVLSAHRDCFFPATSGSARQNPFLAPFPAQSLRLPSFPPR